MLGRVLQNRYRLDRRLGRGGLGDTFAAHDLAYRVDVALKLVRRDRGELDRALRGELELLRGLHHPALVRVRDLGVAHIDGSARPFLTSDLVDGIPIAELAGGPEALREPLRDALVALHYLHRVGIRHGDFSPNNVLVSTTAERPSGTLIDLSAASRLHRPVTERSGTPGLVAPEVVPGARVDARADIFSVGRTLLALGVSGSSLEPVARRACAPQPADRPSSVEELLEALGAPPGQTLALPVRASRLLGRAAQIARFDAHLDALEGRAAGPRVVLVRGPAGSGRSRLLEELEWRAQLRVDVAEGNARGAAPVDELLARAAGAGHAGALARVDALLARQAPIVLAIDGLDRIDAASRRRFAGLSRLLPADAPVLLLATDGPRRVDAADAEELGDLVTTLELAPLGRESLAAWCDEVGLGAIPVERLERATGGVPGAVAAALAAVAAGGRVEDATGPVPRLPPLADVDAEALAVVALGGGELDEAGRIGLGVEREALATLEASGVVRSDDGVHRLAFADAAAVLAALPSAAVARARARLATAPTGSITPARAAALLADRIAAGHVDDAGARFVSMGALRAAAPAAFRAVAGRLLGEDTPVELRRAIARVLLDAGDASAALRAVGVEAEGERDLELCLVAAEAELRRGQPDRALVHARAAARTARGPSASARVADLSARALLAEGRAADAAAAVEAHLAPSVDAPLRARLLETAGLAEGYMGRHAPAEAHLAQALELHVAAGDDKGRLRVSSCRAILEHRRGRWSEAADGYRAALEIAQRAELDDQLAVGHLNLGTALQQAGDFGGALAAYERAARLAVLSGEPGTEATVRFNVANLHVEIGLHDRADALRRDAARRVAAVGLAHLDAPLARLAGEIAFARGEVPAARQALAEARGRFEELEARRDVAECDLLLAELSLRVGATEAGTAALDDADAALDDADDLALRAGVLRGRAARLDGSWEEARILLERARAASEQREQRLLAAEADGELMELYEARDLDALADEHRGRARRVWQRVEATLPEPMRDAFRAHPRRAAVYRERPRTADDPRALRERLRRFLAVNRRLSVSLRVDRVLEHAVDAAIELSGAERGFVLLAPGDDGRLRVAAARTADGARVPPQQLEFSRTIAEEVLGGDRPVVTVDARADARFAAGRSVHAMQLTSVACVPVRGPDGLLGALYVDNRFERGRFAEEDLELLQAFADQAAIAITNATLHARLATRTQELEAAEARLREQVRGQAARIESLTAEVEARQTVLEYRYDYSRIVGRGAAMRAVLATLERVIDSELPVLIGGESGTGKELVARAIHFNGPRRERRLLTLNCAALPETLIESELFGHERGAFTGADAARVGLLASAQGGTVFLDELGEMPPSVQAKLLRVLQEREVWPLGAERPVRVDFRLVCATNRDLRAEVAAGRFREDLYYRVGVVGVTLPPLRDRPDDLPELLEHFLERHARGGPRALTPAARRALLAHRWPGNVRELENVIARACVMCDAEPIDVDDLDLDLPASPSARDAPPIDRADFERREAERLRAALAAAGWNVSRVSRQLGIPRQTLYRKLARYSLERPSR